MTLTSSPPAKDSAMTAPLEAVTFDHSHEGVLDWFDAADEQGNIVVWLMGSSFPKRAASVTPWLKKALKHSQQNFFIMPLLANDFRLTCELVKEKTASDPNWTVVHVRLPLAAFFNLPNANPQQELAQLREFFEWAKLKSESMGRPFFEAPRLQWYREGNASGTRYGLEWAGLAPGKSGVGTLDEPTRRQWEMDLDAWRAKPWFNAWYERNIAGMKKLRIGPHCWASMGYFRSSHQLYEEQKASGIIVPPPKSPSGRPGL